MNVFSFYYRNTLIGIIQDIDYSIESNRNNLIEFIQTKLNEIFDNPNKSIGFQITTVTIRDTSIQMNFDSDVTTNDYHNGIISVFGYKNPIIDVNEH